jgi:hypothetical protein
MQVTIRTELWRLKLPAAAQAQVHLTVSSVWGHPPDGMNPARRATKRARTVAARLRTRLHPVRCRQSVS